MARPPPRAPLAQLEQAATASLRKLSNEEQELRQQLQQMEQRMKSIDREAHAARKRLTQLLANTVSLLWPLHVFCIA